MSNMKEYKDIIAFHPGYYIADLIEEMEITQEEFAIRMGTTPKTVSELVNGLCNISNDLAKKLSMMSGTSCELWLNLQKKYDQKCIEIENEKDIDEQKEIASLIDYSFFVQVAGLPKTKNVNEKIENLCKYFMISNLNILKQQDFLVNIRTGIPNFEMKNMINSRAWIQTAINESKNIETEPYSEEKLKSYLPEIRSMTLQDIQVFLPRLKEIFSKCGIAFMLLPHLKNSGVNGAVKWVSNSRVVLAMNNRGLYADRFWFSLFHEIKHVMQHKTKTIFLSNNKEDMIKMNQKLEDEADLFASNYLIPAKELKKLTEVSYISKEEILEFASRIHLHPGIVVGRLQHENVIPLTSYTDLKVKYTFE